MYNVLTLINVDIDKMEVMEVIRIMYQSLEVKCGKVGEKYCQN